MNSPATKVHDPLFHFETHFPERLSSLNFSADLSAAARRQKRTKRAGTRYKTQPVTFDEIQEVDEEPKEEEQKDDGLKGKFQAFSRSMDGLLPKIPSGVPPPPPRRGSGHPPVILEKDPEVEARLQDTPTLTKSLSLGTNYTGAGTSSKTKPPGILKSGNRLKGDDAPPAVSVVSVVSALSPTEPGSVPIVPVPSPTTAVRRQKITAKAKKRQKAAGGGSEET